MVLAERGVSVTLLEAAPTLGGRLGAWPHTLPDGTAQVVEHGFHAFFRHYYTWRDDPAPHRPRAGVPAAGRRLPGDLPELAAGGPHRPARRAAAQPDRALRPLPQPRPARPPRLGPGTGRPAAWPTTRAATTAAFDDVPAARFLAELGMSDRAQAMLFEAFARSFFARPAALSAGELIAMFHYYFLGNPEGIGFDAPDTDYLTCIWAPLRALPGAPRGAGAHRHARCAALHAARRLAGRDRRGGARAPGTSCWRSTPAPCARLVGGVVGAPRRWRGRRRPARSRRRSRSPASGSTATSTPTATRSTP